MREYRADPGRDNLVQTYVQTYIEMRAREEDAYTFQRRGQHKEAEWHSAQGSRLSAYLHNLFDEMTTAERKAASNVIKKYNAGYMILWKPQSAVAGFGRKWKRW